MDVSAGTARLDHALGDDLAHVRHGNKVAGIGCGRGRRGLDVRQRRLAHAGAGCRIGDGAGPLNESHDVLLGNAPAESGTGDLRKIDVMLAGDLANQWGRTGVFGTFFCRLRLRS